MSERLSEERIAMARACYERKDCHNCPVEDHCFDNVVGEDEWLADHDVLVEELKEADLDNGILLRKAATLAADLETVTAERDRYAACHEAELGVCFQHCDEVHELTAERDRARELAVRLEAEAAAMKAAAETALSEMADLLAEVEKLRAVAEGFKSDLQWCKHWHAGYPQEYCPKCWWNDGCKALAALEVPHA